MSKPINSQELLKTIDHWKVIAFPARDIERKIELYANGGPPPSEDDTCEDEIVPLGFASTQMKGEMEILLDPLMLKPGIIDMQCISPAVPDAARTQQITMQINIEANNVTNDRLVPTLTNGAGRATVTGQCFFYRKSPNDIILKHGRPLLPVDAGIDILDAEWREWAFDGKISLRDVEERLKGSSSSKYGWNREGLVKLKEWILASQAEKTKPDSRTVDWMKTYDQAVWGDTDLTNIGYARPVDVYWYFRKNGTITKDDPVFGGQEKIDLYCISRFGGECQVERTVKNEITYKNLVVNYTEAEKSRKELARLQKESYEGLEPDEYKEKEGDRLLFFLPDVFKGITDCLIYHNDDASVSGDQLASEVRGSGKTSMPKLTMMEGLLTNLIEGLSFASQVTWLVDPGVGNEYLNQLQRGKLKSGQAFPTGVQAMPKQNAITGFNSGMQAIQMLDNGIAASSTANQQGTFGSSNAEFASQAQAALQNNQRVAGRRLENWLKTLDKVAAMVGRTLCREWSKQREAFPCYYDAKRMRMNLAAIYKIYPEEWDADRWVFTARRLAGSMMRQEAIQTNMMCIQVLGPIFPSLLPVFGKEILRAQFGDVIAAQMTADQQPQAASQSESAQTKVATTFVTGSPAAVAPMDDPIIHSGVASKLAEERIRASMEAGIIFRQEVVGIMAVLQYAVSQVSRLPEDLAKPAIDQLSQLAQAVNSIPIQTPPQEGAPTQKEMMELQLKGQNIARLAQNDASKQRLAEIKSMSDLKKLGLAEKSINENAMSQATNRAKTVQDMQAQLVELNAGQPAY